MWRNWRITVIDTLLAGSVPTARCTARQLHHDRAPCRRPPTPWSWWRRANRSPMAEDAE